MTLEEIRAEEDFAKSKDLTLCDICKKRTTTSCRICAHHYEEQFEIDPVMEKIRKAE